MSTERAARLGDRQTCPVQAAVYIGGPGPHVGGPIVAPGGSFVLTEGSIASRLADYALCVGVGDLAVISEGASMVLINGLPAVRVGDGTTHQGKVVGPGADLVKIGGPTFSLPPNVKVVGRPEYVNKVIRDLYFLSTTPTVQAILARLAATDQPILIMNGEDQEIGIPFGPQVVFYDPEDNGSVQGADGRPISCPAQVGLAHELVHAMNNAEGKCVLVGDDPIGTPTQPHIPEREAQAIGVGSHSGDYPTENSLRRDLGLPQRGNHYNGGASLPPAGTLRPGGP